MKQISHWVDGAAATAIPERSGPVYDPASGRQTGAVAFASESEVDAAVESAVGAFPAWRDTSMAGRQAVMFGFRELLVRSKDDMAKLISAEHGKTLDDARGEVQRGLEVVEYACVLPELLKGEFSEDVSAGVESPVLLAMWSHRTRSRSL